MPYVLSNVSSFPRMCSGEISTMYSGVTWYKILGGEINTCMYEQEGPGEFPPPPPEFY